MATNDRESRLLGCYVALRKIFQDKPPLGIELPDLRKGLGRTDIEASVRYARQILTDMPGTDADLVGLIDQLAEAWLDALLMCRKYSRTRKPHYGAIADAKFIRFAEVLTIISAREDTDS